MLPAATTIQVVKFGNISVHEIVELLKKKSVGRETRVMAGSST
jgi:hypothetical protein